MRLRSIPCLVEALLIALLACSLQAASGISTLYGGLGGHNNGDSTNDGALAVVNQATGAVTVVGHPAGVSRISGLAFDPSGILFASTQSSGGFPPPPGPPGGSRLLQLNPATGSILASAPISDGHTMIAIADLAVQPVTGLLFGVQSPTDGSGGQGKLYVINKGTGLATLVGNTGHFFGAIGFAPNGTLYMAAADLDFATGNVVNPVLLTLNPATAATLTSVPVASQLGALGVRPEDGVIFAGNGDQHQLFTINPVTGAMNLVGDTGSTFVGDLAFQTPLTVGPGQCVPLPFNLAAPAGPLGIFLTLTSNDPTKAVIDLGLNPNLFVSPGETTDRRTPQVCGVNFGTATVTISGGGQLITIPVLVTAHLNFYPAAITSRVSQQIRPTLLLSSPAPGNQTITLKSDNPVVASVPGSVVIPAGSTSVTVPVTALSPGTTIIRASSTTLAETTLVVTVQ